LVIDKDKGDEVVDRPRKLYLGEAHAVDAQSLDVTQGLEYVVLFDGHIDHLIIVGEDAVGNVSGAAHRSNAVGSVGDDALRVYGSDATQRVDAVGRVGDDAYRIYRAESPVAHLSTVRSYRRRPISRRSDGDRRKGGGR